MRLLFLLTLLLCPPLLAAFCNATPGHAPASASESAISGQAISGGYGVYTVRAGDNLTIIAARLGTSVTQLKRDNPGINYDRLKPGQTFAYENRHIVPPAPFAEGDAILINIPQRMLFRYRDGLPEAVFPVAVGRPDKQWQTPLGDTRIQTREKDKAWIVPPSIQAEMRARGERVLTRVPPGPDNPLGRYWLGLERQGYGIHGTNAPASVYSVRTHGCIRLQPEHIEQLYAEVYPGVPVRIIYAPVLLYVPPDGPIWLEAHPDAYAHGLDYPALARMLADAAGVTAKVDPAAAELRLAERDGIAHDVSRNRTVEPAPAAAPTGPAPAIVKPLPAPIKKTP